MTAQLRPTPNSSSSSPSSRVVSSRSSRLTQLLPHPLVRAPNIIGPRRSTATAMVKHPSVTYGVVGPHHRSPHSSLVITRQLLPRWRAGEPSRRVATTVVARLGQVPSPLWHFSPSSDVGRQVRWIIPVGQIWPK
jgi:hypothetical protein